MPAEKRTKRARATGKTGRRLRQEQRPEINLYMYSLNQEFPVGKGHSTFLQTDHKVFQSASTQPTGIKQFTAQVWNTRGQTDWSVQWVSNEWIENYTYYPGAGLVEEGDPLANIVVREERFGGILFDRLNDRVYRVNVAGYRLFQEILESYRRGELSTFRSREFAEEEVAPFLAFMKNAGLIAG